jgi:hypothetical protein
VCYLSCLCTGSELFLFDCVRRHLGSQCRSSCCARWLGSAVAVFLLVVVHPAWIHFPDFAKAHCPLSFFRVPCAWISVSHSRSWNRLPPDLRSAGFWHPAPVPVETLKPLPFSCSQFFPVGFCLQASVSAQRFIYCSLSSFRAGGDLIRIVLLKRVARFPC